MGMSLGRDKHRRIMLCRIPDVGTAPLSSRSLSRCMGHFASELLLRRRFCRRDIVKVEKKEIYYGAGATENCPRLPSACFSDFSDFVRHIIHI